MLIHFADLFAGIGGFRLGIERAAAKLNIPVQCVFSSEIDKSARIIYDKNFGEYPAGDITQIPAGEIPDINILCGGFPCQAFSVAGKRQGFSDTRGTMFFEIARIAAEKRPDIIFLENVKGLLNHDRGRTFGTILYTLDELGYDCEWQVFNSKDHGVPQNRERVFIIGHTRRGRTGQIFPIFGETTETTRENSSTALVASYWKGIDNHGERTHIMCCPVLTPDRENKRQNGRRMKNDGEPMFTLTSQDKHGVLLQHFCGGHQQDRVIEPAGISSCLPTGTGGGLIPKIITPEFCRIRKLTPTECERLQSFPDGWTEGISDTARYRCLGNAVTVNVVEAIAEKILISLMRLPDGNKNGITC